MNLVQALRIPLLLTTVALSTTGCGGGGGGEEDPIGSAPTAAMPAEVIPTFVPVSTVNLKNDPTMELFVESANGGAALGGAGAPFQTVEVNFFVPCDVARCVSNSSGTFDVSNHKVNIRFRVADGVVQDQKAAGLRVLRSVSSGGAPALWLTYLVALPGGVPDWQKFIRSGPVVLEVTDSFTSAQTGEATERVTEIPINIKVEEPPANVAPGTFVALLAQVQHAMKVSAAERVLEDGSATTYRQNSTNLYGANGVPPVLESLPADEVERLDVAAFNLLKALDPDFMRFATTALPDAKNLAAAPTNKGYDAAIPNVAPKALPSVGDFFNVTEMASAMAQQARSIGSALQSVGSFAIGAGLLAGPAGAPLVGAGVIATGVGLATGLAMGLVYDNVDAMTDMDWSGAPPEQTFSFRETVKYFAESIVGEYLPGVVGSVSKRLTGLNPLESSVYTSSAGLAFAIDALRNEYVVNPLADSLVNGAADANGLWSVTVPSLAPTSVSDALQWFGGYTGRNGQIIDYPSSSGLPGLPVCDVAGHADPNCWWLLHELVPGTPKY